MVKTVSFVFGFTVLLFLDSGFRKSDGRDYIQLGNSYLEQDDRKVAAVPPGIPAQAGIQPPAE